jgi:hypothetical protein
MSKTPPSILVVSILAIIYSSIFVLGAPCGMVQLFHPFSSSPATDALHNSRGYFITSLILQPIQFFTGILLLSAAIGGIKLRPWARPAMNAFCAIHFVMTLVGLAVSAIWVLPIMTNAMAAAGHSPLPPGFLQIITIGGMLIGLLFNIAIISLLLYFFNRKFARDAFAGILPPSSNGFPTDPSAFPQNPPA